MEVIELEIIQFNHLETFNELFYKLYKDFFINSI